MLIGENLTREWLPVPKEHRDPKTWVILGSGPNLDADGGWYAWATRLRANVFCVNGSILLCGNPSAYLCTDPVAVNIFKPHYESLSCEKIIGRHAVERELGEYTIGKMRVRSAAMWAVYWALRVRGATSVHVFGVHGAKDGTWSSVSSAGGSFADRASYTAAVTGAGDATPCRAHLNYLTTWKNSNENAAKNLVYMRKKFRGAARIDVHGDGPVPELIRELDPRSSMFVIVGGAPSLVGSGHGQTINEASTVLRVNPPTGNLQSEMDVGSRTDIWFGAQTAASNMPPAVMAEHGVKHAVFIGPVSHRHNAPRCERVGIVPHLYPPERHELISHMFAPPEHLGWNGVRPHDWSRGYRPTSGILAIDWVLNVSRMAECVVTAGIDGMVEPGHHYDQGDGPWFSPEFIATELAILNTLRLTGLAMRIEEVPE